MRATLLALACLHSTGCITYATYKKLDTGEVPLSSAMLVGLGETFAGDALGLYAADRRWAPDISDLTWLAIGNAVVLGVDAICATALYILARTTPP